MRLRSGVFAFSCLLVQALGVALFLRGFFPVQVRSLPRNGAPSDLPPEPPPPGKWILPRFTSLPGATGSRVGWSYNSEGCTHVSFSGLLLFAQQGLISGISGSDSPLLM